MADVFLSYARADAILAETVAAHLATAGYSVWWDRELLPHNSFADAIEAEIRGASSVVVLWSEHAVTSQWVRAEADLARNEGKLVQTAIDACSIPLPFNQHQTADLTHWKGKATDPHWQRVLASIAVLTEKAAATPAPAKAIRLKPKRTALLIGAVLLALIVVAGGYLLAHRWFGSTPRGSRIAVQPFQPIGDTPDLRNFATSLSGSLQNVLTRDQLQIVSPAEAATLNGAGNSGRAKALGVGLIFNGTVQREGATITTRMRLEDPVEHATLWTAEVSGPIATASQLQARVGALTVAVLACSAQALNPKDGIADPAILQAFLHACDLAETSDHGSADMPTAYAMLDTMRKVAHAAPDFAAGHSVLAKHIAFLIPQFPDDQVAALKKEALAEAQRALALNPSDPDGYVALGLLAPANDYAQRERYFRQALAADPAWPHANGFLGNVMSDLGRLDEALTLYQRAAAVNPQSQDWTQMEAHGLIWTGQFAQADADLDRFGALWPDNFSVRNFRFQSMRAQHRWGDALAALDRIAPLPDAPPPSWVAGWRALLLPLKANDTAALQVQRKALLAGKPFQAMFRLAMLGFTDDAFAAAEHYTANPDDRSNFLFAPETAPLRRDPRFMVLAEKFGLVSYWQKTDHWPDFCAASDLPYDCKQVAATLHH